MQLSLRAITPQAGGEAISHFSLFVLFDFKNYLKRKAKKY